MVSDTAPNLQDITMAMIGDGPDILLEAPVWIAWRRSGKLVQAGWVNAPTLQEAFVQAKGFPDASKSTAVELCIPYNFRPVPPEQFNRVFVNSARGRIGIEIRLGTATHRIPPTLTIANNRRLMREIEIFAHTLNIPVIELQQKASVSSFAGRQFLCELRPDAQPIELFRGNLVIRHDELGPAMLNDVVQKLSSWMLNNLHPSGRMTYKYWPSRGEESRADNTIRQFMATVALGRIAQQTPTESNRDAFRRNLEYNLGRYYAEIRGFGAILLDGKAKLGAAALSALAILESRQAHLIGPEEYQREFEGLCRGIDHLWQPDGAFRTFLVPEDRNDNQNFYPGEALLFWAALHRQTRDPSLADKCLQSFKFYRDWHFRNPNPAFVPWHSQAYAMLYEDLQVSALADFIFARNDWLLEMQQWGGTLDADLWGRFFNPERPEYGPPHASSTGVYMEGLADAWHLARELGDSVRADRYAKTLRRGFRSIAQLQFRDPESDMFYISRQRQVLGGLRTTAYNNEIRVDNVQHCLMALMKLNKTPDFPWPERQDHCTRYPEQL